MKPGLIILFLFSLVCLNAQPVKKIHTSGIKKTGTGFPIKDSVFKKTAAAVFVVKEEINRTDYSHSSRDSDEDGLVDSLDLCPTQAGPYTNKGCPSSDQDNDGIPDKQDLCPSIAGVTKYNGCPIPDTDGDGINDEIDKCPNIAGPMKLKGCPPFPGTAAQPEVVIMPQTGFIISKQDSLYNATENTKHQTGKLTTQVSDSAYLFSTKGKNLIQKDSAIYKIYFNKGIITLSSMAYNVLNGIGETLDNNHKLKVSIRGYTATDEFESNAVFFAGKRAEAVHLYLLSIGVPKERVKIEVPLVLKINPASKDPSLKRRVDVRLTNY